MVGEGLHHAVGRRPPDEGQGEGHAVGGHGQVLDGGGRLEDLDVARGPGEGLRTEQGGEGGAQRRRRPGVPAERAGQLGSRRRTKAAVSSGSISSAARRSWPSSTISARGPVTAAMESAWRSRDSSRSGWRTPHRCRRVRWCGRSSRCLSLLGGRGWGLDGGEGRDAHTGRDDEGSRSCTGGCRSGGIGARGGGGGEGDGVIAGHVAGVELPRRRGQGVGDAVLVLHGDGAPGRHREGGGGEGEVLMTMVFPPAVDGGVDDPALGAVVPQAARPAARASALSDRRTRGDGCGGRVGMVSLRHDGAAG